MLEIRDLVTGYGSGEVVRGISLRVEPGAIVSLVGSNGAGKSTTLKALSGLLPPYRGEIQLDGHSIKGRSPSDLVKLGIAHVPEGRQIFTDLSVEDNLLLGAYSRLRRISTAAYRRRLAEVLDIFPDLGPKLRAYGGSLSGGQQQMLSIGRGLMSEPRYLMLDEPSLGLAPRITELIFRVIDRLKDQGVGVLLVEQNGRLALVISQAAHLLENGRITLSGTGQSLLQNQEVIERYLGVGTQISGGQEGNDLALALQKVLGD